MKIHIIGASGAGKTFLANYIKEYYKDKEDFINFTKYVFNNENKTITRITQGAPMSDYITDDRTMKSQYRLVDIF